MNRKYGTAILFEKKVLISGARLPYKGLPEGVYRYDIRLEENTDTLEKEVMINHIASVVSRDSTLLDDEDIREIGADDLEYRSESMTIQDYADEITNNYPNQ